MCRGNPPGRPAAKAPTGTANRLEQRKNKNRTAHALRVQCQVAHFCIYQAAERARQASLRVAELLRTLHPAAWLVVGTALVQHRRSRAAKRGDLREIRSQVFTDDFHIAIVTTAALPWMTGTAINPLLRAAYLSKAGRSVTLAVPWLHPREQALVFPGRLRFADPQAQERHIRLWLAERGGVRADFRLRFYPASSPPTQTRPRTSRAALFLESFSPAPFTVATSLILPLGDASGRLNALPARDVTGCFEAGECDVCVLEEPEHLNWYHSGANWRHRFKLVIGVVHTNYLYYARMYAGAATAAVLKRLNEWMCGAYCDRVIKLSGTIQPLPRAVVCNVHGVRSEFLEIGRRAARSHFPPRRAGAYFLGKVLWAKGHRLLIDYLALQQSLGQPPTHVDVYGGGEDLAEVEVEAAARELRLSFFPPTDHSGATLRRYKVFINPSQSEVLSTTTAEALAMGKFVVVQRHPSNDFFMQFRNTLPYDTPEEFLLQAATNLLGAFLEPSWNLLGEPEPLSAEERRALSWEGATDRFLEAVSNCTLSDVLPTLGDHATRWVHATVQKGGPVGDRLRRASGAGPVWKQSWLAQEKWRAAPPTEIVEASILATPPGMAPVRASAAPPRR
ncbi:digalactosyldiacylglycerol synthase [Emiliania huxleyi CCMP1516]|uniref:digalactosyldiacylglycerol synthase n=2 Tax=Emiliania huxleyi TaxID=2903 RepID=A0A0D3ID67_EMIH1|nr:digalactosyldiacylglycerol synthase [Emiliania huxleyi CCMP1516]EOD09202.1 digalactosyldiacylglycerol synthase [Emiliania huxleyi CCMP1516]|eukprot:XP_005761631.1 digalactosyldiacylglycerol synthase [Emiliania huxleyi CCMP1516]